jgi:hypothetical protein
LSYFINAEINVLNEVASLPKSTQSRIVSWSSLDNTIYYANIGTAFVLVLLLPGVMGHFFACNHQAMLGRIFACPQRWRMLIIYTIAFMTTETLGFYSLTEKMYLVGLSNEGLVNFLLPRQLIYMIVALLQFLVIMMVSSRQSDFIQAIRGRKADILSEYKIIQLLQEYENIKEGVGPFYALVLSIHSPIILCVAYFGLNMIRRGKYFSLSMIWSIGSIAWSGFTIIHLCLLSEACYEALQKLVSPIR